jgi:hypothetical protein
MGDTGENENFITIFHLDTMRRFTGYDEEGEEIRDKFWYFR